MKKTIIDLFEEAIVKHGERDFLLEKHDGAFQPTSYKECKRQALNIGAGLTALGIKPINTLLRKSFSIKFICCY